MLLWFWIVLIMYVLWISTKQVEEGFTPKIRSLYRPHFRRGRLYVEQFVNTYSPEYFTKLLKRANIY